MILVDTSVWVDHLRTRDEALVTLLETTQVCTHPFIIGELACGNIKNRNTFLSLIKKLPGSKEARHEEVFYFIEHNALMGKGVGFIDMHLLTSVALTQNTRLWTRDKRLAMIAEDLQISFSES